MSSIAEIMAKMAAEREAAAVRADEARVVLAADLITCGATAVTISFAGCGDSGQIDGITVVGTELSDEMLKRVEAWAYGFLEGTGVDWYNNDGGQGEIEFDLTTAPVRFSAYIDQNETVSSRVFDVEEGA